MHKLPIGTVLKCINVDHVDFPRNYQIDVDDLVIVVAQNGKHHGDTTMVSLMRGVFFRCEYSFGCLYDTMNKEACYEVFKL